MPVHLSIILLSNNISIILLIMLTDFSHYSQNYSKFEKQKPSLVHCLLNGCSVEVLLWYKVIYSTAQLIE